MNTYSNKIPGFRYKIRFYVERLDDTATHKNSLDEKKGKMFRIPSTALQGPHKFFSSHTCGTIIIL